MIEKAWQFLALFFLVFLISFNSFSQASTVRDTSVFGQNLWYVYAYNAPVSSYDPPTTGMKYLRLDPTIVKYAGMYEHQTFNINTREKWPELKSPSHAPGYVGNVVSDDNHVYVYKREGFPCGTYKIGTFKHDDPVRIIVDNVVRFESTACCSSNPNLTLQLDGKSKVEIRVGDNKVHSYLEIDFIPLINTLANHLDNRTCYIKGGSGWNNFTLADGKTLVSIDPGASTLGNVLATTFVSNYSILVDACAPIYDLQTAVMGRRWTINPTIQPVNDVKVRLYFSEQEYNLLKTKSLTSSNPLDQTNNIDDLKLSKYHHPINTAVNGDFNDNCANIPSGDMTIWTQNNRGNINSLFTGFNANGRFVEFTVNNFSEFWLHGSINVSPLSVELKTFDTYCEQGKTVVNWSTHSEKNNAFFTIEESVDGINWTEIQQLQAAGNTQVENNYQITLSSKRKAYYRLVQTDFDGKNTSFHPVLLNCHSVFEPKMEVFPNPNKGQFILQISSDFQQKEMQLKCISMDGKTVFTQDVNIDKGNNSIPFNNLNILPGTYILQLNSNQYKSFSPIKLIVH